MLRVFTEIEEEKRLVKALTTKSHFSEWLRWDGAMAVDLSWKRLLYHQSDSYLHFALNSIEDTCPQVYSNVGNKKVLGMVNAPLVVAMLELSNTSCVVAK